MKKLQQEVTLEPALAALLDTAADTLAAALSAPFDFWACRHGQWSCLSPHTPRIAATGALQLPLEHLSRLLAERSEAEDVLLLRQHGDWHLLVFPLIKDYEVCAQATALVSTRDPQTLQKCAQLVQRELQHRLEIDQLANENYEFARQVTENFEELVFLRQMAEHLEVVELSKDALQMAESVLPLLTQSVKAESVVIVGAHENPEIEDPEARVEVGDTMLWEGSRVVEKHVCRRLVAQYQRDCLTQPVVKNFVHESPEGAEFPGVREFILVPMVKSEKIYSWLLALNRVSHCGFTADESVEQHGELEFGTGEATLLSSAASMLTTHASNIELLREKEKLLVDVVRSMVYAVEAKDDYTCGHSERVALFGKKLGQKVGLDDEACERLYLTGLLHDVGKIGVSDATLRKPGRLTDEEFDEIKRHPDSGWAILHELEQLRYVLPGVLYHHERYDGKGYPDGLAGKDIPRDGRILAVVDAYDAMTSNRPYRKGMPQEKAESILREGSGTQWDPELIDAFFEIMPEVIRIRESYQRPPQRTRKNPVVEEEMLKLAH